MRSFHSLLAGTFLVHVGTIQAQDCSIPFNTPLYPVQEEHDVYYGTATRYNGASEDLYLNIFKPTGDGQLQRPLIIVIHGGGFTGGHRDDRNDLCRDLASMGWAAATISYRLDFYGTWLLSSPWAYDPAEVIRAAYRAQQDARGAVRFLKARSAMDSTSADNIMLWGFSAGAIAALHAAYVDDPSEKPAACGNINNVVHFLSSYPRPDLGPFQGSLNLNGQDASVRGVASFYGGLLDTNLIPEPLHPALFAYHQNGDPVVGCYHQQGLWGMPLGVGDNYPYLFGSCIMDAHIQEQSPSPDAYQFHEYAGGAHEVHDEATLFNEATLFLRALFCSTAAQVRLALRVMLQGPYDPDTGLMNDALRSLGTFPLMDPYPGLGYVHTGQQQNSMVTPSVIAAGGPNAIVDWVLVELRQTSDPAVVLASRSALLQRDGDVVDLDGSSPVTFDMAPGNYQVAVRHRNHLGVMTADPVLFETLPEPVDLAAGPVTVHGVEAQVAISGTYPAQALWAGDVSFDGQVKYAGPGNDRDPILSAIGGSVPTAVLAGYHEEDVDLDGQVKYAGTGNDRDHVLQTVGGSVPTAVRAEQLP
ncbi:MAG: carboxylesterase family protein [Flavobacteriales bacterium]|nr:carboxylesterase family protein [Flavobacteriales bacterium]